VQIPKLFLKCYYILHILQEERDKSSRCLTHLELFAEFTAVSVQHCKVEGSKISIKAIKKEQYHETSLFNDENK